MILYACDVDGCNNQCKPDAIDPYWRAVRFLDKVGEIQISRILGQNGKWKLACCTPHTLDIVKDFMSFQNSGAR